MAVRRNCVSKDEYCIELSMRENRNTVAGCDGSEVGGPEGVLGGI